MKRIESKNLATEFIMQMDKEVKETAKVWSQLLRMRVHKLKCLQGFQGSYRQAVWLNGLLPPQQAGKEEGRATSECQASRKQLRPVRQLVQTLNTTAQAEGEISLFLLNLL